MFFQKYLVEKFNLKCCKKEKPSQLINKNY